MLLTKHVCKQYFNSITHLILPNNSDSPFLLLYSKSYAMIYYVHLKTLCTVNFVIGRDCLFFFFFLRRGRDCLNLHIYYIQYSIKGKVWFQGLELSLPTKVWFQGLELSLPTNYVLFIKSFMHVTKII